VLYVQATVESGHDVSGYTNVALVAPHAAVKNIIYLTAPHWWLVHGGASASPLGSARLWQIAKSQWTDRPSC